MKLKINFTIIFLTISLGLLAQGKFYVTPQVFAFVGSYKGINEVNKNQDFIFSRNFTKKDFLIGASLSYYKEPLCISVGIEQAAYSSGFIYKVENRLYNKTAFSGRNVVNLYTEVKYDIWNYKKRIPKKWRNENNKDKFLIVSKFSPFIGFDYLRYNLNTVSKEKNSIGGPVYRIPYEMEVYQNRKDNFGIRTGVDWTFYNGEKRKFVLSLAYKFAFNVLAYGNYRFQNLSRGIDFKYQTSTRGNGFSIKAGFPIKLFETKKK
jgi:hypothetical protein